MAFPNIPPRCLIEQLIFSDDIPQKENHNYCFFERKKKDISQDLFCVQYFRGKKIHTDWDLRVEQAEFKELTVIKFILLYMNIALGCFCV